jgi:hypothetical protein
MRPSSARVPGPARKETGMFFFRKKKHVEEFAAALTTAGIPRAVQFFHDENARGRYRLGISDQDLIHIGAGMCMFFLSAFLPEAKAGNVEAMQRAFKACRKTLPQIGGNADRAGFWWKAFNDGLLFHEQEERLTIACRVVWDSLFEGRPFKEHGALKAFGYFLQMEVDVARKFKLV